MITVLQGFHITLYLQSLPARSLVLISSDSEYVITQTLILSVIPYHDLENMSLKKPIPAVQQATPRRFGICHYLADRSRKSITLILYFFFYVYFTFIKYFLYRTTE